nr:uncharacterized protein SPAC110.05 [Schizosaccharomyces pombe]CCD31314.1 dubious [Schizosaccharomyces pombe]|eukprot:NP_001343104.1 uncharacterized protein SPAC110.05 [Schizosaccharomyces pombe]
MRYIFYPNILNILFNTFKKNQYEISFFLTSLLHHFFSLPCSLFLSCTILHYLTTTLINRALKYQPVFIPTCFSLA